MVIVLDDVHVTADTASAHIPGFLAGHLPPSVRLILVGRPGPLPPEVARLAGQGQALLLDARNLRFQMEEASRLLNGDRAVAVPLSVADVESVQRQTEGWPLALSLLRQALRVEGRSAIDALPSLGRDRRELYDFLRTQVIDRLEAPLRRFLLQISILDPIDPAVCGAITSLDIVGSIACAGNDVSFHNFAATVIVRYDRAVRGTQGIRAADNSPAVAWVAAWEELPENAPDSLGRFGLSRHQ